MGIKFVHTADWQLGARFTQFGANADGLRRVRLDTLGRALSVAKDAGVDAFLIAGDLFEDSQVDDALIRATLNIFARFPEVPVFILPGNHDPNTRPGSIWSRKPFTNRPAHVTVLAEPVVCEVAGAYLIAAPLKQKISTTDPSLRIAELAKDLPPDRVRIGVTHGALAIPGKHQPNDFPIHLEAASRAVLDYLAVGHWHTWQICDNGRLVMPGTPEPDAFDQDGSGHLALVEIAGRGATPQVQQIPVGSLEWVMVTVDLVEAEAAKSSLQEKLSGLLPKAAHSVLRVVLRGGVSPRLLEEFRQWLEPVLQPFPVVQVVDETTVALLPAEFAELQRSHPLLALAVADLAQIEHLAATVPLPPGIDAATAISLAEAQQLLAAGKIELPKLDSEFFKQAHRLLFQKLQEASR
jgi:DNA repair exonuclease SbcCD nuclease subunit